MQPDFFRNPTPDQFDTYLAKIASTEKFKRYYEDTKEVHNEGYYQTLIGRRYTFEVKDSDDFILFDKELVIGFKTKDIKDEWNKEIVDQQTLKIEQLRKTYNGTLPEEIKPEYGEFDFLGLNTNGDILIMELKQNDPAKTALSPIQTSYYYLQFQKLAREDDKLYQRIKAMIEQKIDYGLIGSSYKNKIPLKLSGRIIPCVIVGEDSNLSKTICERYRFIRDLFLPEMKAYTCTPKEGTLVTSKNLENRMNLIIHRGADQIGGCITEISTENCKILIDFGSNLPGCKKEELTEEQVKSIIGNADAVFYTHYHSDHVGLHHLIPTNVLQYIGVGAKEVMLCKYDALRGHGDYSKQIEAIERMETYCAAKRIDVSKKGKIFVTPYFVSHSAFDAYMFLIECEGKKILHTGDFRRHGYIGKGLFPTLKKNVGEVDILITEGTMLGRSQECVISESEIQKNIIKALREHKYVFALCSSTDLDRLATFHAACKKTGRIFLVDEYQNRVLNVFTKYAGCKSDLFQFNAFKLINYRTVNVRNKLQKEGFLMPIRMSSGYLLKGMLDIYNDEKPWLIYSMWGGYAKEGKDYTNSDVINIRNLFGDRILDGTMDGVHTSGHADVETLKEVCQTVHPRIGVIPIHKDENSRYDSISGISSYFIFDEGDVDIHDIHISVK